MVKRGAIEISMRLYWLVIIKCLPYNAHTPPQQVIDRLSISTIL
jgi:hypothetical protein